MKLLAIIWAAVAIVGVITFLFVTYCINSQLG